MRTASYPAYIVDNGLKLLIPEYGHGVSSLILFVCLEVNLVQVLATVKLVHGRVWILIITAGKLPTRPALIVAFRIWLDSTDVDEILQAL